MTSLLDLKTFITTVDLGSLSAAARLLGLSPAAASASLKRLELELGTPLLIRSTRSLRLTQQGERFLSHCRIALDALEAGIQQLTHDQSRPQGKLQLAAPSDFGRNLLLNWLDDFYQHYPEIQIHLHLSDRMADLYRQPVDIALRYGKPPDSNLIALPLAPDNRRVLCAAPSYLQHRPLRHPDELPQHRCLCFLRPEEIHDRWRFVQGDAETLCRVPASLAANDGDILHRWALMGKGIAYKSRLDVATDLQQGRLSWLLPDWLGDAMPLYLVCPDRRHLSPAVTLLRDFIQSRCQRLLHGG